VSEAAVSDTGNRTVQAAAASTTALKGADSAGAVHLQATITAQLDEPTPIPLTRAGLVESVVSGLFKLLGLMSSAPEVPPENPLLIAMLAWSRRIDSFLLALFQPPAGAMAGGHTIAGTAQSFWFNMDPSTGDKLTAQVVKGSDGVSRMVVSMTGMRDNLSDALLGNTGWLNPQVSNFIDKAYENWGLSSSAEIMLVGFSNGGQQMQNYAAAGKYGNKVAVLLLFGAPLTKTADEITADSLLIQDLGDKTYLRYTHGDAVTTYGSDDSDLKAIFPAGNLMNGDTHSLKTYERAAAEFDNLSKGGNLRADWAALADHISRFAGTVMQSPKSIQIS
jgi:hypothetical protein